MLRRKRLWKVLAPLAALMLVAAACGDDDDQGASSGTTSKETTTYKIAFVGAETGDNANLGINIRNGARVAVEEANEDGGNIRIELATFDTAGDPAQASTVKDDFINDDKILGIVGPAFSGETKAVLPDLEEAGLVMISASATNKDLPTTVPGGSRVFHRIVPDDDVQGAALGDYIVQKLAAKKAAYVHDNSDYGKGLAEGTKAVLESKGVATVTEQVIDPKSQDFSAAVNNVKAANPDVIFYGGYYAEAGRLKKQLNDAGVTTSVFMSGDGTLDPGFIEAAGDAGNGAQITCACNLATVDSPGALGAFAKKYKEVNGGKAPGTYSSEGYDAAKILIEGIKQGNTTREKLLNFVENVKDFDGISKKINFAENGNIESGDVFIFEVKDSKLELLGTTSQLVG